MKLPAIERDADGIWGVTKHPNGIETRVLLRYGVQPAGGYTPQQIQALVDAEPMLPHEPLRYADRVVPDDDYEHDFLWPRGVLAKEPTEEVPREDH